MVRAEFPQVHLIANDTNPGFAAANNQAIRASRSRHILLLNPDTRIIHDAPAQLVAFLDGHPAAGAVGAKLYNPDGSLQQCCFRFPGMAQAALEFWPLNHRLLTSRLNGRYPLRDYNTPLEIDFPLGASLTLRRAALEQVGLLDEGYFMYCEEVDLCLRLRQAGWHIFLVPAAEIVHYGAQSSGQFRYPMFVTLYRSRYR